jgi:hypothetical protein
MYMCGPSMSVLILCIQNRVLSYFQCWLIDSQKLRWELGRFSDWFSPWEPKGISIDDTWMEKHTFFGFGSHLNENQPFENRPKGNERYQWWFLVVEVYG